MSSTQTANFPEENSLSKPKALDSVTCRYLQSSLLLHRKYIANLPIVAHNFFRSALQMRSKEIQHKKGCIIKRSFRDEPPWRSLQVAAESIQLFQSWF